MLDGHVFLTAVRSRISRAPTLLGKQRINRDAINAAKLLVHIDLMSNDQCNHICEALEEDYQRL